MDSRSRKHTVAIPYWQFKGRHFKSEASYRGKMSMSLRIVALTILAVSIMPLPLLAQGTTVYNGQTYTTLSTAAPSYNETEQGDRRDDAKSHHRCGPPPGGFGHRPPPEMDKDGNRPPPPPMDSNGRPLPPPDGCRPPPPPENSSGKFEGSNQSPN